MTTEGKTGYLMTLSIEGHALAESRDIALNRGQEEIDLTSRDSAWWKESTPGLRDWTITGGGLYIYNDRCRELLDWHWHNHTPAFLTVIVAMADGSVTKEGQCYVTSISDTGPYAGAAETSFTLRGAHDLNITAS